MTTWGNGEVLGDCHLGCHGSGWLGTGEGAVHLTALGRHLSPT